MPIAASLARRFRFAAAAVAALLAAGLGSSALAQGTQGSLPDPITTRELDGYLGRLNLSEQQRQAVQSMHDQYREEFRVLRETDIERFLEAGHQFDMGMLWRDRAEVEKGLRELQSLLSKIRAVDDTFFNRMQAVLTEEQIEQLPGVSQARERARYRSGLTRITRFTNPAAQVELRDFTADLSLSPPEQETLDPLLAQYESSLTTASKRLYDASIAMVSEVLKKVEEQGITQQENQGGRRGRGPDPMEQVRLVWNEANGPLRERTDAIADLNRQSVRNFAATLTPDNGRDLKYAFYQRAYREAMGGTSVSRALVEALKIEALSPEQRQAIEDLKTSYFASLDPLVEQMVAMIDENRAEQNLLDFDRDARRAFEEKLSGHRDRRNTLNESTRATLDATLGPELSEQLARRVPNTGGGGNRFRIDGGEFVAIQFVGAADGAAAGAPVVINLEAPVQIEGLAQGLDASFVLRDFTDAFVPGPIGSSDLDAYSQRLGLDEDGKSILRSLHADYMEHYQVVEDTDIAAVREGSRSLRRGRGDDQAEAPSPTAVDELYALRRRALATILGLDSAFFDDVQLVLTQDADGAANMARIRASRERDVYNRGASGAESITFGMGGPGGRGGRGGGQGGPPAGGRAQIMGASLDGSSFSFGGIGSRETSLDLSDLVEKIEIEPAQRAAIDADMLHYEQSVTATFKQMFEASMRVRQATDRMMTQFASGGRQGRPGGNGGGGGNNASDPLAATREMMETEGRAARDAGQTIQNLNRQTLEALKNELPPIAAAALQQAYNETAYPSVYRDRRSARPQINAALALDDLTPQQQSQLQEVAMEFNAAYDALCEQLVALAANSAGSDGNWDGWQEQQREREKITFDRNDLSDRTLARMRLALSDEQVTRLGGLEPRTGGR